MEAIIINNATGIRRVQDLSVEEYYEFGSTSEHLTPGHGVLYHQETEKALKSLIWEVIHQTGSNYPKTNLNVSEDSVKQMARTDALIKLRNKIDNILKSNESIFI